MVKEFVNFLAQLSIQFYNLDQLIFKGFENESIGVVEIRSELLSAKWMGQLFMQSIISKEICLLISPLIKHRYKYES